MRVFLPALLLCACASAPAPRPFFQAPAIPMTAYEDWRCNGQLPDGRYITVYFQGQVQDTQPEVILGEGRQTTVVNLNCALIPLGR